MQEEFVIFEKSALTMAQDTRNFSIQARLKSFYYAFTGMKHVLRAEHNMWIHLSVALAVIILGALLKINRFDWLIVILCIGFVLSAEIMNTAIEKLTDKVSPERNEVAGLVKDISACAVLVSVITAVIAGLLVFMPYIIDVITQS